MPTYNNDIEMAMDFLKLSLIADASTNVLHKQTAEELKKKLLTLLPAAKNERMIKLYTLMQQV